MYLQTNTHTVPILFSLNVCGISSLSRSINFVFYALVSLSNFQKMSGMKKSYYIGIAYVFSIGCDL